MDRSYLSRPEVIAASKDFVCVRLTTYEDEVESRFMKALLVGRSGQVENTTFTILAPDGKTTLTPAARGTRQQFANDIVMAKAMNQIAARYPAKAEAGKETPPLPVTLDARIGLNVAAGDLLPLAVVIARDDRDRAALEARLARVAWQREFHGRMTYATMPTGRDLPAVAGLDKVTGYAIIEPDAFGQKGKVVAALPAEVEEKAIVETFRKALAAHTTSVKTMREHRAAGTREGAFWETKLPVTDPMEASARARTKESMPKEALPKSR